MCWVLNAPVRERLSACARFLVSRETGFFPKRRTLSSLGPNFHLNLTATADVCTYVSLTKNSSSDGFPRCYMKLKTY
jgi:hypothetical protein